MHHQHFAIATLIDQTIAQSGLDDTRFIKVLGYSNVNKGLRRLESWRTTGSGEAEFLKRIASQFGISKSAISESLIKTIEQLNEQL